MLEVGSAVPEVAMQAVNAEGEFYSTDLVAMSRSRKVVVFALPGAFTPTCSAQHLPGYIEAADDLRAKGVEEIACLAMLDQFVLRAWANQSGAMGKITMLADGNGTFTKQAGMEIDLSAIGFGTRSKRYAMVINDGKVQHIAIEPDIAQAEVAGAQALLGAL